MAFGNFCDFGGHILCFKNKSESFKNTRRCGRVYMEITISTEIHLRNIPGCFIHVDGSAPFGRMVQ